MCVAKHQLDLKTQEPSNFYSKQRNIRQKEYKISLPLFNTQDFSQGIILLRKKKSWRGKVTGWKTLGNYKICSLDHIFKTIFCSSWNSLQDQGLQQCQWAKLLRSNRCSVCYTRNIIFIKYISCLMH